ncbi:uncharacterized protein LOC131022749 [Salvia miltiorrhiza]|uniref:uncharacterized protein LOC131022749 n=1 Tax=Salvia miltiorrhiza TaxID=226208 RepID=UPI0025ACD608|nr:uncharacterized protein LOC131022749 [Salvia miltiorrhiza]
MQLNALRLARPSLSLTSFPLSYANHLAPPSAIRFVRAASGEMDSKKQTEPESKKQTEPESQTLDSMSSLGEGYATRSDEEGFGGIYRGNQSLSEDGDDKNVHADALEFDHDQGSHVKEKEKARNQAQHTD